MNKLPIWEARDFLSLRGWHFQSRARSHKKYTIQSVKILSRARPRGAGKKRQPALVVMSSPFFITRRVRLCTLHRRVRDAFFVSFFYPRRQCALWGKGFRCDLCIVRSTHNNKTK